MGVVEQALVQITYRGGNVSLVSEATENDPTLMLYAFR